MRGQRPTRPTGARARANERRTFIAAVPDSPEEEADYDVDTEPGSEEVTLSPAEEGEGGELSQGSPTIPQPAASERNARANTQAQQHLPPLQTRAFGYRHFG